MSYKHETKPVANLAVDLTLNRALSYATKDRETQESSPFQMRRMLRHEDIPAGADIICDCRA